MRDLVASAVGFDETRGDVITIRSMAFEPIAALGTEAIAETGLPININVMSLIQIGVMAVVALVLGLFVVRPILTSGSAGAVAALPPPYAFDSTNGMYPSAQIVSPAEAGGYAALRGPGSVAGGLAGEDPVARLRKMIDERQEETFQILQSWIEDPDEVERV